MFIKLTDHNGDSILVNTDNMCYIGKSYSDKCPTCIAFSDDDVEWLYVKETMDEISNLTNQAANEQESKMSPEQEKRCIKHLSWMIATLEFQKAQTGLNDGVVSPELKDAKALRDELINENFI